MISHTEAASLGLPGAGDDRRLERWLRLIGLLAVVAVLAPIAVVLLSWTSSETEIWQHLIATQLGTLLRNTAVLVLGVGTGVVLLGVSLAWLTVMCEFPGRRVFDWALMLPMAVPAYVLAFVTLGLFDFSGPVQGLLRSWQGPEWQAVDVRSDLTVVLVLVLVLYPYVYMLARSAFLAQGSDVLEAARVLGCNPWQAFFRVALPMARPAIVAGASLALMETLADFGTVAVFNYDTFTTAIYKAWFGFFSLQAAAQLASLLLLFVALTLYAERRSRGRASFVQGARLHHHHRYRLSRPLGLAATGFALVVLTLAFIAPLLQLLIWVVQRSSDLDARFVSLLLRTLTLAAAGALITVTMALLIAWCRRRASLRLRGFFDLANLGYALPGSVLAVGIVLSFTAIEQRLLIPVQAWLGFEPRAWLVGSVLTLLAAYWIRFLAVASGPVETSLGRIRPSIPEAARTLGASQWTLFSRVILPILKPGLLTGLVLVFVDIMKEMPATLLLRPFGWDTLAIRIFELTAEGEWERAALPAVTLVLAGLIPVAVVVRRSARL